LSIVLDHDFGEGLTLKNNLRYARYDKLPEWYPGSAVDAAGNMTLAAYNNENLRTNIFNQTDVTKKLITGSIEHTFSGGGTGPQNSDNVRNSGFFGPPARRQCDGFASNPFAIATAFRQTGTDANNVCARHCRGLVQDEIAFTSPWKVLAGVRTTISKSISTNRRTTTTRLIVAHRR